VVLFRTRRTSGKFLPTISLLPSVDPSSTTRISKSEPLVCKTASRQRRSISLPFRWGMTTVTVGCIRLMVHLFQLTDRIGFCAVCRQPAELFQLLLNHSISGMTAKPLLEMMNPLCELAGHPIDIR